jgi:hypothetical protein
LKPLTHPGFQLNHRYLYQWRHELENKLFQPLEFIELNDCFYRNLHNYEYLVIIDMDEVIVPVNGYNWSELIEEIKVFLKSNFSSKLIFN